MRCFRTQVWRNTTAEAGPALKMPGVTYFGSPDPGGVPGQRAEHPAGASLADVTLRKKEALVVVYLSKRMQPELAAMWNGG